MNRNIAQFRRHLKEKIFTQTMPITFENEEIEITVSYKYTSGTLGTMYNRNGDPGDPPEAAEVDIHTIKSSDGKDLTNSIPGDDDEKIIDYVLENHVEEDYDPPEED